MIRFRQVGADAVIIEKTSGTGFYRCERFLGLHDIRDHEHRLQDPRGKDPSTRLTRDNSMASDDNIF
jgi:hypothetical protein